MVEKKITFHRIVSLAAFLTETLYAVGAGDRVAGVTDSCDFPDEVKEKPNVSSWFEPDLEKLIALAPDLVVGMETAHGAIRSTLESEGIQVILVNPVTSKKLTQKYLSNGFADGIPMWSFSVVMTEILYPGFVQIKNGDLSRLFDPGRYTNSTAR